MSTERRELMVKTKENSNVNIEELKVFLTRRGMSLGEYAKRLGITRQTLAKKMDGKVDFKLKEAQATRDILNLSVEDWIHIFFD